MHRQASNQIKITIAGCLLAASCALSFGQRKIIAASLENEASVELLTGIFILGLLFGGLTKDILKSRNAGLIGCMLFFFGVFGEAQLASLYWLIFGGGWVLAISNGLFSTSDECAAGRWLNFTHAFYRGAGLFILLASPSLHTTKWIGFSFVLLATLILYFTTQDSETPSPKKITDKVGPKISWFIALLVSINFLAGATELWSEQLFTNTIAIALLKEYDWILAGMMFLGRLLACTPWFCGPRQLLICSVITSLAIFRFPLATHSLLPIIAMIGAFFSASIFPSVLGWVASVGGRWRGTLCGFGQIACMLAAPLAVTSSKYALVPGLSLIIISSYMFWSSTMSQRLKHQRSDL